MDINKLRLETIHKKGPLYNKLLFTFTCHKNSKFIDISIEELKQLMKDGVNHNNIDYAVFVDENQEYVYVVDYMVPDESDMRIKEAWLCKIPYLKYINDIKEFNELDKVQ